MPRFSDYNPDNLPTYITLYLVRNYNTKFNDPLKIIAIVGLEPAMTACTFSLNYFLGLKLDSSDRKWRTCQNQMIYQKMNIRHWIIRPVCFEKKDQKVKREDAQVHGHTDRENCPGQVPVIKFESVIELLSKENTLERVVMLDRLKKRILAYPKYGLGYNLMRNWPTIPEYSAAESISIVRLDMV